MGFRLVQLTSESGERQLAAHEGIADARLIRGYVRTYDLAMAAIREGRGLSDLAAGLLGDPVDLTAAEASRRLLAPIEHQDPAHLLC
jgi:hypothetical protein